jgi:hypothetical protein
MAIEFSKGFTIGNNGLGTIGNPAISAIQLYNAGIQTSGWYYIQTQMMTSSVQVYCNQTDNGGGWMLISYHPSGSNTGLLGYPYPNADSGSLQNPTFIKHYRNVENLWFNVSGSAQCNSVMRMASTASVQPHLANCSIAHSVTYSNPNALDIITTTPTTLKLAPALTGSWSAIKGYTSMTASSYPVMAPCDWQYDTNWWTVAGPTSAYPDAPYGRSGNAQGTGGWTNRGTNQVYGLVNTTTTANGLSSTFNTLAVYIK